MSVRFIAQFVNRTSQQLNITDKDNNTQTQYIVPPNSSITFSKNRWVQVPWAGDLGSFPGHHFEIPAGGKTWAIWQANRSDGDYIRCSNDTQWKDSGYKIDGQAAVSDDQPRTLFISSADPVLSLSDYQAPAATSGTIPLGFYQQYPGDPIKFMIYQGTSSGAPVGAVIDRIINTALDKNNNGVTLNPLTYTGPVPDGSVRLDPSATVTAPFAGLLAEAQWTASGVGYAFNLPGSFTLLLYWKMPN